MMRTADADHESGLRSSWAVELDFAREVARRAGALLIERLGCLQSIEYKSATDVVTEADHLSEELIVGAIRQRFPDDAVLAEESGHSEGAGVAAMGGVAGGRTWVVDPLDGTVNYANAIPLFCVSIALVADRRPVMGVVLDPVRDEVFSATADGPATLDGRPIHASLKERLTDFVVSLGLSGEGVEERWMRIRPAIRVPRAFGSAALTLAYVANGRFDAFVQESNLSPWDVAAAGLIAERAGATVSDPGGGPWFDLARQSRSLGVVAAPPAHHGRILELLQR